MNSSETTRCRCLVSPSAHRTRKRCIGSFETTRCRCLVRPSAHLTRKRCTRSRTRTLHCVPCSACYVQCLLSFVMLHAICNGEFNFSTPSPYLLSLSRRLPSRSPCLSDSRLRSRGRATAQPRGRRNLWRRASNSKPWATKLPVGDEVAPHVAGAPAMPIAGSRLAGKPTNSNRSMSTGTKPLYAYRGSNRSASTETISNTLRGGSNRSPPTETIKHPQGPSSAGRGYVLSECGASGGIHRSYPAVSREIRGKYRRGAVQRPGTLYGGNSKSATAS